MKPQRIAIIGAGGHARDQHYPALRALDEVELCAACDLDERKLQEVREQYEIPAVYTDYREMIEKEAPDGVVVVMPPMPMFDVAMGCLDLGAHLLIEKPPACTSAQALRLLDRAERGGRIVMVSLNRRFMPLVRRLKDMARERKLVYCSATYNKDGFFQGKWTWPSPLPVADSIHLIDLLRFVAGDVAEVFAASASLEADFTNSHAALVVHETGASSVVNTHHCVGYRVHRFELHAIGMSAYLDVGDTHNPACELYLDGERVEPPAEDEDLPAGVWQENFYETRHFARVVAGEEVCDAGLADAIESMRLAEALAVGYRGPMSRFAP